MKIAPARLLFWISGVLALTGVALRLAPVRLNVDSALPAAAADLTQPPRTAEQPGALLSYQPIVESNIFSRNRRPPDTRFVPPELVADPVEPDARAPAEPRLRLFGVAVGPTGAVALIDADPSIPGAEVYRLGDVVGDARLVVIEDDAVVLEGPGGRTVLRLPSLSRR
jgi:hypothetical protein